MKKQLLAGLGILLALAMLYMSFDYKTKQAEAQLKNQFVPNLIPITDNLYELGTSTKAFLKVYANEYCLQGDCITSWATGGGGGAGGGWSTSTPNIISTNWLSATNALVGINTSTPRAILAVKGISGTTTPVLLVTSSTNATLLRVDGNGSTTIASLGTGPVYSSTGALYTNGTTGTGLTVQATSPTLVTPILGVASGTALTLSNNLWVSGTLRVTGSSTLATTSIPALSNLTSNGFVKTSGGIGLLSVDTATYLTGNQTITLSGDVSGSGETSITTAIGADKVTEAMLKVVDTPTDEDILTYESTTGDFEWHTPAQLSLPTYTYASSSYVHLWNLQAGSNITITTSSVPTIAVSSTPTFTTLNVTATTTLAQATTTINGVNYYWPSAQAVGTKILQNDGTGQLSWVADQSGGGGSLSGGTTGFAAIWASSTAVTIGTLRDNGAVSGVNATSSTVSFNIQGTGALNPFNVASSTGNSLFQVAVNGSTTVASLGTGLVRSSSGSLYTDTATYLTSALTSLSALSGPAVHVATTSDTNILISISTTTANTLTFIPSWTGQLSIARGGTATSTAPANNALLVGTGAEYWQTVLPSCSDTTNSKLLYNSTTRAFSCGTDQAGGGGSLSGGTVGFAGIWASSTALTIGTLRDNGTVAGVNATSSSYTFNIQGGGSVNPFNVSSSTGVSMFTITQTGNVGIGTTTPGSAFVVGNVLSVSTSTNVATILDIATSTGTSYFTITGTGQLLACASCRLTIPQGATPSLTTVGDIGIDTSNGGMFSFYAGGRENLNATTTKAMLIESPTASESLTMGVFDVPITITRVQCLITSQVSMTPSWTFSLPHGTSRGTASANAMTAGQACTSTTTPQNITIGGDLTLGAGEVLWATSSAVSNASTTLIQVFYKYDN